jgi:dTDP-4-amino-4,6-dideoxygalactose transaminase
VARIPLVRPDLGEAEAEAAARVVRSGWLTQGPEVAAFEAEFAVAVGAPHAVAVSNCTVALQLALAAVGVGRGDEVATVSHSFIATANAIVAVGARPVFVDVEEDTLGMDPARLERALTPGTRAVLCVHQLGLPCDLTRILAVARARGLPVVEDAACALGSEVEWGGARERIGRPRGDVACFSLHPRKVVTTGDGGVLTTQDAALARVFQLRRQHAMSIPDTARHDSSTVVFEEYLEPAFNHRLTDLQAAVGRPQIARLTAIVAERRRLAAVYHEALAGNAVLAPPRERPGSRSNWQSYPARLREGGMARQIEVLQFLLDRGVAGKRGVHNAHQEPAYRSPDAWTCGPEGCRHDHAAGTCPRLATSERLRDTTVLLPLYHGMRDEEQAQVLAALTELHQGAGRRR